MLEPIELKKSESLERILNDSIVPEINIYNQAYLMLNTPLVETEVFHASTSKEIPLSFELQGEIRGRVICFLNMDRKSIPENKFHFFQSLYIESMNIVLGQFLTNIEKKTNYLVTLTNPELNLSDQLAKLVSSKEVQKYGFSYKLICEMQEFDCRIVLLIDNKRSLK